MALVLRVAWCVASELKNVKLIYMCVGKERGEVCPRGRRLFSIRKLSHYSKRTSLSSQPLPLPRRRRKEKNKS